MFWCSVPNLYHLGCGYRTGPCLSILLAQDVTKVVDEEAEAEDPALARTVRTLARESTEAIHEVEPFGTQTITRWDGGEFHEVELPCDANASIWTSVGGTGRCTWSWLARTRSGLWRGPWMCVTWGQLLTSWKFGCFDTGSRPPHVPTKGPYLEAFLGHGVATIPSSTGYARGLDLCSSVTRRWGSWYRGTGNISMSGQRLFCGTFGGKGVATPGNVDGDCRPA
jgi:hypothetical protein